MKLVAAGKTDLGTVRESNQDAFFIDEASGVFIVCDGMGGHLAGDVAAKMTIDMLLSYFREHPLLIDQLGDTETQQKKAVSWMRDAIDQACLAVFREASSHEKFAGMGTTLTMLVIRGGLGIMAHVGDSRLYLYRKEHLHQLSKDHTIVQDLVDRGVLELDMAVDHPHAHVLTRAVGVGETVQADICCFDVLPDDYYFLCTDGVFDCISIEEELPSFLGFEDLGQAPGAMIERANALGADDNVTAVMLHIEASAEERQEQAEKTEEVLLKIETLQQMYLFQSLHLAEIVRVMGIVFVTSCKAGDMLMEEGAWGSSLFIVMDGTFEVRKDGKIITEVGKGSHLGDMALLSGAPRSSTVVAKTDAKMLRIEKEEFDSLALEEPVIGVKLLRELGNELSKRLAQTNELVENV